MMTPEQRFDRLERIAKLFAKEGLEERRRRRETNKKMAFLIDLHARNIERFHKSSETRKYLSELQSRRRKSPRPTDSQLDAIWRGILKGCRKGKSSTES
ncbi:MAG: hypothetical protein ICV68_02075 [Pyrinomonadaceae bacterium]|nr:hypothetical protein [Pyrinomonadaceae bacterium]